MNDIVSVVVISDAFDAAYERYAYVLDVFTWSFAWFRLWWICYRADELATQVHLTAKIMLENDINSFPEKTRKMALDFLDQLLHRYVRITAWGFYDVNKELLFMVLGYQFGLCLICTQFTTSGIQLVNNITTVQPNSTTIIEK
ncbi:uncharacterized protein LOC113554596 [Rhopalosiphum maidis]|uniref:uncharacterized protein LOC113554596 n=1 Tax=Rhopalosiphum maidis TaxID=43146 RepID=UPI000F00921D|nr:uncharacterized protein LOC113554596 [Rhopalosiphum maidis]